EDDLKLAHEVQQAFLPQKRPDFGDYKFYSFYRATNLVGGDYYDFIEIDENRLAVIVADVVGHGIAAALLMAKVAAESRFALAASKDAAVAVDAINRNLSGLNVDRFATALIGILDKKNNSFTYSNAGHMPPVIRKQNGEVEIFKGGSGLPVGVLEDADYAAAEIQLDEGDVAVLFTDGINEAMNESGEILGMAELIEEIKLSQTKTPSAIGKEICQIANRHMGSSPPHDDMCLVCFGRG
ncbi:MAG: PP2C family protein-serine/threonine phosphatase, partial [Planctomycetota bacterium]